jgi:hypothetical protein
MRSTETVVAPWVPGGPWAAPTGGVAREGLTDVVGWTGMCAAVCDRADVPSRSIVVGGVAMRAWSSHACAEPVNVASPGAGVAAASWA